MNIDTSDKTSIPLMLYLINIDYKVYFITPSYSNGLN